MPLETAVTAFGVTAVLILNFAFLLPVQRQHAFLDDDFHILLVQAGNFGAHLKFLASLAKLKVWPRLSVVR